MAPPRPMPTRVVVFIDGQNLYYRCREHFGWPWAHPVRLAEALVEEDRQRYGAHSHVLSGVRYYTGIHDRTADRHNTGGWTGASKHTSKLACS